MTPPDANAPYAPQAIAGLVAGAAASRPARPLLPVLASGVLGGSFVAAGAMLLTLAQADGLLGVSGGQLAGGLAFAIGMLLVVVTGAELFAADLPLVFGWADGRIGARVVLRDWALVALANFAGAFVFAIAVWLSGHAGLGEGAVAAKALEIADARCRIAPRDAFFSGLLANAFVCTAMWIAIGGRSLPGRVALAGLPVVAMATAGFEHAVANAYLVPLGILLKSQAADPSLYAALDWGGWLRNLVPVALGNLAGGALPVAGAFVLVYGRDDPRG